MLDAATTVTVSLRDRRATIEDVQDALDTLRTEGIPDSFEVEINQSADREYAPDVPYAERKVTHSLVVSATRAAKSPA